MSDAETVPVPVALVEALREAFGDDGHNADEARRDAAIRALVDAVEQPTAGEDEPWPFSFPRVEFNPPQNVGNQCGHVYDMSESVSWSCDKAKGHDGIHGTNIWKGHPLHWTDAGEYVDAPADPVSEARCRCGLRDENAALLAQVERLQSRLIKAEEPRPQQPIDDFGGNIRSMYIRVSEGWLRRFDRWRKAKGLSRSGAIRKLVQDAWEEDK